MKRGRNIRMRTTKSVQIGIYMICLLSIHPWLTLLVTSAIPIKFPDAPTHEESTGLNKKAFIIYFYYLNQLAANNNIHELCETLYRFLLLPQLLVCPKVGLLCYFTYIVKNVVRARLTLDWTRLDCSHFQENTSTHNVCYYLLKII